MRVRKRMLPAPAHYAHRVNGWPGAEILARCGVISQN